MESEGNEQERNIPKKMRLIDKIYAAIGVSSASALTICYILAFAGVVGSLPLIALGIATTSIYYLGSFLEEKNILNFQGLRDLLPKSQPKQLNLSPDQEKIEGLMLDFVYSLTQKKFERGVILNPEFLKSFSDAKGRGDLKNRLQDFFLKKT